MKGQRLFIGVYPCGIAYSDRETIQDGDYKRVAFLDYDTLELEVRDDRSPLLDEVRSHAATVRLQKGERFSIDACGHSVVLGARAARA